MSNYQYFHLVLGGTFDHLHSGHTFLIDQAFKLSKKITIGICDDSFLTDKFLVEKILPYHIREKELHQYLKKNSYLSRVNLITLHDKYGVAITDPSIDSIIVTKETKQTALEINKIRKKTGLKEIHIISFPLIKTKSRKIIRSSLIRKGNINREGVVYHRLFKGKSMTLPPNLRSVLRIPLGKVVAGDENNLVIAANKVKALLMQVKPSFVITVGDIATLSLQEVNYFPDLSIIDLKTRRTILRSSSLVKGKDLSCTNPAGNIHSRCSFMIQRSINKCLVSSVHQQIIVHGEEDLLALPAIIFSPLGGVVIYGQYNLGLIMVEVTESVKERVIELISKFNYD